METLIRAKGIVKNFPGVKALKNVDFDLRPGEVHALLGENGAGKSTLVKILSGVYTKDEGEIFFEDQPVVIDSPKTAQAMGINIIHQELNLFQHLTVAQNVYIGREFVNGIALNERQQNAETKKIMESLDMDIKPTEKVRHLTVSKQQMVEIAKSLSANVKVLIMDEPTSSLTEREIDELFVVINELKRKGTGIIYISHRLEELARIADRVSVFRDGEYVATKDYKDVTLEDLIKLMVGREITEKFPRTPASTDACSLEVKNLNSPNGTFRNVNFQAYKGEILGFAGLVGAGRTELARALFGADKISGGQILVNGKAVVIKSPRDAIANGIVYAPEDRKKDGLAIKMDVAQNISLASIDEISNMGVLSTAAEKKLAEEMCGVLQIKTPNIMQKVKNLSGGNQQKIVVAKWINKDPEIYIFDEPTRGIDVGAKVEIYNLLNNLKEKGKTVIIISSELPEVMGISDRLVVMCEGEIKAELDARTTTQEEVINYATMYQDERSHA